MSILNVDKVQPIGSGSTVTINATDTILTNAQAGVITATSFSGSGANLTSIPAGQLTGALPAISGASLTNLPVTAGLSTNAQENTYGGHSAGASLTSNAENNVLIGKEAGTAINNGDKNTALGAYALKSAQSNVQNVAVGYEAGYTNANGNGSVFIGFRAGKIATGGGLVAIGNDAMYNGNASAAGTVAIGWETLAALTSGQYNVVAGYEAARSVQTGGSNIGLGYRVLNALNSANRNIAIGSEALKAVDANGNVAIGDKALKACTGTQNVAIGEFSAQNMVGFSWNTIIGQNTAQSLAGSNNTIIGSSAATGAPALAGGSNNTIIGAGATVSSATVSNEITVGNQSITKFRVPGINFVVKDNGGTPSSGQVLTADGSGEGYWAAAGGGGKILQVVQEHRTDVWSESNIAPGAKTGAAVTKAITTTVNNNKVLVTITLTVGWSDQCIRSGVVLKRGGTEIALADSTGDNKTRLTVSGQVNSANWMEPFAFTYLDSPGSAATYTYTVHTWNGSNVDTLTAYLNRAGTESNHSYRSRGTSSITLMEVSP